MDKSKITNKVKFKDYILDDVTRCIITKSIEDFCIHSKEYLNINGIQFNLKINKKSCITNIVLYNNQWNGYVLIIIKSGKINYHDIREVYNDLSCLAVLKNDNIINFPFAVIIGILDNNVTIQYVTLGMRSDLFISKFYPFFSMVEELKRIILEILNMH